MPIQVIGTLLELRGATLKAEAVDVKFVSATKDITAERHAFISSNIEVGGNVIASTYLGDGGLLSNISTTLQEISDNGNTTSNTVQFTNATTGIVVDSNIVVGGDVTATSFTGSSSRLTSGLITNTDAVTKKTYSYSGTITSGDQPYINVNFTSNVFYSKISGHLVEDDEEISTIILELGGGHRTGATPTIDISIGAQKIFGGTSTNPWSYNVTTTGNTVSLKPSTPLDGQGDYHLFIEYTSPSSDGGVTTIDEDSTPVKTFNY
jgi:hypothetical protein